MSFASEIINATAAIIEALTPVTDPDVSYEWLDVLTAMQAEDDPQGHRSFTVTWSEGFVIEPFTGQFQRMVVTRGLDISIVYRIEGRSPRELEPQITEDGDQIAWALINPTNKPTLTGMQFIQYSRELNISVQPSDSGASLIMTITVPVQYRSTKY